jgi:hypothetical protein
MTPLDRAVHDITQVLESLQIEYANHRRNRERGVGRAADGLLAPRNQGTLGSMMPSTAARHA